MADISKRIRIQGDSSQFDQAMQRSTNQATQMFRRTADEGEKSGDSIAQGFSSFNEQVKQMRDVTKQMFDAMVLDSRKVNTTIQDRLAMIREEIAMLEKASVAEKRRNDAAAQYDLNSARQSAASGQMSLEDLGKAEQRYKNRRSQNTTDDNFNQLRNQELREMFRDFSNSQDQSSRGGRGRFFGGFGFSGRGARNAAGGVAQGSAGAFGVGAFASLSLGAITSYIIQQAEREEIARGRFRGISGNNIQGGLGTTYGMSNADFIDFARQVARSRGTASNINQDTSRQLGLERGFGLDMGALNQLAMASRLTGSNFFTNNTDASTNSQQTTEKALVDMIRIFTNARVFNIEKGDFSMVGEKIEDLTKIMVSMASQGGFADSVQASSLMASLGRVGGNFSNQNQMSLVNRMNKAITDPTNQFAEAAMLRSLSMGNEGMSLFQLKKQQEMGAFGLGNIENALKFITNNGKLSGDVTKFNTAAMLNLNLADAERLVEAFSNNPKMMSVVDNDKRPFNQVAEEQEFQTILDEILGRGKSSAGRIQKFSAGAQNMAAAQGSRAISLLEPVMSAGLKLMEFGTKGILGRF